MIKRLWKQLNRNLQNRRGWLKSLTVLVVLFAFVAVSIVGEYGIRAVAEAGGSGNTETAADLQAELPELTGIWADDLVAVAESQIGYTESEDDYILSEDEETRYGYTKYGDWYGNAYAEWNGLFVSFCLNCAEIPEDVIPQVSDARSMSETMDESGLFVQDHDFTPRAGDLIFLDNDGDGLTDRVGILTEVSDSELTVIEGDLDGAVAETVYQTDDERTAGFGIMPDQDTDSEPVTYTAGCGGVEVSVTVPSDALAEDSELQVVLYDEGSAEYARALSLTENAADSGDSSEVSTLGSPVSAEAEEEEETDSEIPLSFSFGDAEDTETGTAVMDIFFMSGGEEVEPDSAADVTIDASELLSACDSPAESLEVWHLAETEDGTEPVLVADISDPETAADGIAEFTVDSFSEFEFHYTCSASGWAGFGTNLIDENGDTISATVSDSYTITSGRYTTTVDMPYTFTMEDFAKVFTTVGIYFFQYATVTDPNYGDTEHEFDEWPNEAKVGEQELYGSKGNPVVSVTIDGTATTENPNYDTQNIVSKTWHFTLTYEDGTSVTIPIYGNQDGGYDNGGKYSPEYLELNLYFEAGHEVVLNLGNGNGTYSDGDYTGSPNSGGNALRYGTGDIKDYADEDGIVTINLPSDDDLAKENDETVPFTVVDETDDLPEVTVNLGKEQAYDYKLIGWINIATGEYYDVSGGPTTAVVDLSDDNVFYADWIAASYDHGFSTDENLKETVSTKSFVTFDLFDYNELFDLYSVSLTQDGTNGETWTDSGTMYTSPLLGNDPSDLKKMTSSFIFLNNGTTEYSKHVLSHANPAIWNLWTANPIWADYDEYNFVLDAEKYWNITGPDSTVLGMLYKTGTDTDKYAYTDTDGGSLGVHYVGSGDYLFWVDEDGYYNYDSAKSGAAYNQTDQRFYVYEDNANSFFPYNGHTDNITSSNGMTNYWFGMSMDVQFYLPTGTASGSEEYPVNQINGNDMIFDFSGDDDIMIFVDGKMVVDMAGIHSTSYSRINFSTNTVTYSMDRDADGTPITDGSVKYYENDELNLSAGFHTLTVRYMERGASASNLEIRFNVAPTWEYDSWPVQTVTAEKVWKDSDGNEIEPEDLPDVYKTTGVEVGLFDKVGEETDDEFGYTQDGNKYTVVYTDDKDLWHEYVFTKDEKGNTLTYTEGKYNDAGTLEKGDPVTYSLTDEDGKVLDSRGYVIAWLEDDLLHIRIDEQTLSDDNDWTYAWELLDADGDYEVLELSGSSSYVTTSKKDDLTTYDYWSIIGELEIEEYLRDPDSNPDFRVILTEAAQEAEGETLGDTDEAYGWVIVASADGTLSAERVKFSHYAELFEVGPDEETEGDPDDTEPGPEEPGGGDEDPGDTEPGPEEPDDSWITYYYSLLGVTSVSEIDALGSGAVWYLVDSGKYIENMGDAEEFYLYCLIDGERYYLAMDESGDSLIVTADSDKAELFYYDFLGELRIVRDDEDVKAAYDRVVIDKDGNVSLDQAEREADVDDVRFYTLKETETTGFSFTATNTFLPDITLVKEDTSVPAKKLSGVSFTLTNEDGLYYGYFDKCKDEVVWLTDWAYVYTDEEGQIEFHYMADGTYILTETGALDGYNTLPSSITIKIEEGKIVSANWTETVSDTYKDFISVSDDGLSFTVKNQPGARLPSAGGSGTPVFYIIGGVLIVVAGFLMLYQWRQNTILKKT